MSNYLGGRLDARSMIISVLATAMALSLLCSLSMQYGHADVPIAASAEKIKPLQVDQNAPRFVVKTVAGEPFAFEPRELERPAIIITFRGGWCPYCNMHLSDLRKVMPEIRQLGFDILFLSGDRPELLYKSLRSDTQEAIADLDYRIYSDADAQAAIALGIAFKTAERTIQRRHEKGEDIAGSSMLRHGILPVPAVFMIDTDGKIVYTFIEADYKVRLPAEDLLEVARNVVQ
ncbi:MAG: AhpC/TSA family protein [Gammaproteobacteria bacterium]|nr:AhpC/TSA family protein [Gammaproteobacteria bacterium]